VRIEVTDSGPELPEKVLPHVLDRFCRQTPPASGLPAAAWA
jgi:nitrogen-specific signal transduction histidine kinase